MTAPYGYFQAMKRLFVPLMMILIPALIFTQGEGERQTAGLVGNPEYEKMLGRLLSASVPIVGAKEALALLESNGALFLDVREVSEFSVSRIPGALHVGYTEPDISRLESSDRSVAVVVYCSVGYRSEKIAERLKADGFLEVRNLYGGIFEWRNLGYPLEGPDGATETVHGYSPRWGRWINIPDSVVY